MYSETSDSRLSLSREKEVYAFASILFSKLMFKFWSSPRLSPVFDPILDETYS